MTRTSSTSDELKALLHAQGMRATAPRLAVLTVLHEAARPCSHAELSADETLQKWDPATIYRILSDLTGSELLRRMDLGDHIWRFELRDACRSIQDDHAHFLCTDCGHVTCLPPVELRPVGAQRLPQSLRGAQLQLRVTGRCSACIAV